MNKTTIEILKRLKKLEKHTSHYAKYKSPMKGQWVSDDDAVSLNEVIKVVMGDEYDEKFWDELECEPDPIPEEIDNNNDEYE